MTNVSLAVTFTPLFFAVATCFAMWSLSARSQASFVSKADTGATTLLYSPPLIVAHITHAHPAEADVARKSVQQSAARMMRGSRVVIAASLHAGPPSWRRHRAA